MINFINPYQTEVLLCLNRFYLLFMVSLPCSLEFTVLHFFLGIKPIRKNILTMFLLFLGQGLLYVIDLALFGETLQICPIL